MPIDTEENETKYILEDIQPSTIGLVPFGANGETFFLLKSQEEQMEQDYTIEEVPVTDSPSDSPKLWQRLVAYVDGKIAKATMTKEEKIAEAAKTLGISAKKLAAMMGEEDEEMEGKTEKETEVSKSDIPAAVEAVIKAQIEATQAAHKAEMEAVIKMAREEVEKAHQAEVTALKGQVEELSKSAAQAKEEAEIAAFIEKAGLTYRALPLSANQAGRLLHKLSKGVDETTYAEVEALLKSVDAQAFTAGLFGEIGTSRSAEEEALEEKVAKAAAEGKDPGQALLSLSVEDQRKLLAEERARVGGKK